jgi:ceramide glucosyltransferase
MATKRKSKGAYMISAVAEMYEIHPQTLRLYEREGLLKPSRTEGNTRLYTDEDLERLEFILNLARDLGVNIAGIAIILQMRERMEEMNRQMQPSLRRLICTSAPRCSLAPAIIGVSSRDSRAATRLVPCPNLHAVSVPPSSQALSLFKPLHGADPGLEAYLESFFTQDYPAYEILFCARDSNDAGLATARRVASRHPNIPVKFLSTGGQPDYINDKVISLEKMAAEAAHEIFVISDSDVRVTPDYLRAMALPFADERVGGMCCLYRGVAAQNRIWGSLWARLEAVGMSVEMSSGVLAARAMEGMKFTLGPTMAFRRETIRQMGGFRVTADYCADDFVLGNETHKLGQTVALSHHSIDHMVLHSSLAGSLKHQIRWMKSTRFSRPLGHVGAALTFSVPFGLLALAATAWLGHPAWGFGLLAWSIATRLALSIAVGRSVVGDSSWFGLLVLYPIRDSWVLFLGGQLCGPPHPVARPRLRTLARRKNARCSFAEFAVRILRAVR